MNWRHQDFQHKVSLGQGFRLTESAPGLSEFRRLNALYRGANLRRPPASGRRVFLPTLTRGPASMTTGGAPPTFPQNQPFNTSPLWIGQGGVFSLPEERNDG